MGGAISDLVSKVYNLEHKYFGAPDMNKGWSLFDMDATKANNPLLPGYIPRTDGYTTPIVIPQNGWLRIMMSATQAQTEKEIFKVRLLNSTNKTLSVVIAYPGTSVSNCDMVPVVAGESVVYGCHAIDGADINATQSTYGLTLYPCIAL